jgi:hypothetical protein
MVLCASLFSQLVALFNKSQFYHLVRKHRAERYSKGCSSWDHFVAMLFGQSAQAKSLREICGGLACTIGKLRRLGMKEAPRKSTLSYVNTPRPWHMFRGLFYQTVDVCRMVASQRRKFRFKNKLLSMDSTIIALCLSLFPWAEGIFFVTQMKDNADFTVLEEHSIPITENVLRDQVVRFSGFYAQKDCPYPLRRVVVWDPENEREIVLLTNHLKFGANTQSAVYGDRWRIENFFKALKQDLKIKTFAGASENALHIQIWAALIAMLLIKYLQFKSKFGWSLSNLVAFLRWNLFTYRDLWEWIDHPSDVLPLQPKPVRTVLSLPGLGQHLLKGTT